MDQAQGASDIDLIYRLCLVDGHVEQWHLGSNPRIVHQYIKLAALFWGGYCLQAGVNRLTP